MNIRNTKKSYLSEIENIELSDIHKSLEKSGYKLLEVFFSKLKLNSLRFNKVILPEEEFSKLLCCTLSQVRELKELEFRIRSSNNNILEYYARNDSFHLDSLTSLEITVISTYNKNKSLALFFRMKSEKIKILKIAASPLLSFAMKQQIFPKTLEQLEIELPSLYSKFYLSGRNIKIFKCKNKQFRICERAEISILSQLLIRLKNLVKVNITLKTHNEIFIYFMLSNFVFSADAFESSSTFSWKYKLSPMKHRRLRNCLSEKLKIKRKSIKKIL
eukprot:snap_masked-scaffold_19-processed-gene-1.27-mRNA-1 protein AED:1.00 eAED:1.00 QI:0/0/0/0/1/1/2/0/273